MGDTRNPRRGPTALPLPAPPPDDDRRPRRAATNQGYKVPAADLTGELPRLRDPGAFRSWLITVTAHQAFRWKRKTRRRGEEALTSEEDTLATEPAPDMIQQLEQEQALRDADSRMAVREKTRAKSTPITHKKTISGSRKANSTATEPRRQDRVVRRIDMAYLPGRAAGDWRESDVYVFP